VRVKFNRFSLWSFILGLLVILWGLWLASPRVSLSEAGFRNRTEAVVLPWSFDGPRRNVYLVMEFEARSFSPRKWQVVPDDQVIRVKLNGKPLSLDHIPAKALKDYTNGFTLDLSQQITSGTQRLEIWFQNQGGPGGIDVRPVWDFWHYLVIYLGTLCVLLSLAACCGLTRSQKWILSAALITIFSYWSVTPWLIRAHDVSWGGGHYDYIEYVATKNALPKPTDGWVFYHPPVYYLASALVWKFAQLSHLPVHESLQLFSILLWLVFLVSALATVNLFTRRRPWAGRLASVAIAFWPAGILHSPAIGNDAPLYAVAGLATWMLCRWWLGGKRRDLLWAALFCGLSLLIKSNGIVLVAAAGLLLLLRFLLKAGRLRWRAFADGCYFGVIAAVCLAASMAVRVYYYLKGESSNWLISNLGNLHSALRVPADIKSFLPLDVPTFLTQPYMSPFLNETGRENFWNFLLRSAITGEFKFSHGVLNAFAYVMGVFLLLLFFTLAVRLCSDWKIKWTHIYRHLPLIVVSVLWLASLVALRIKVPYSCSNDFRYVLPILIPLVIYWVRQGAWPRWLLVCFSASSAIFYTATGLVG
jgi:hypothetical protein